VAIADLQERTANNNNNNIIIIIIIYNDRSYWGPWLPSTEVLGYYHPVPTGRTATAGVSCR
jgi:hypothetical protein